MSRTSNVFARVEPEIKEQAEKVLEMLGIPIDVKLPKNECLNVSKLSLEQFNMEIQKGYDDIENGRVVEADQVAEKLKQIIQA